MDSRVILDSMKAGEGQKGRQRELTHQSKNSVVKTEQRVSSIALTILGAKVSHYKMPFSLFFYAAKQQEEKFTYMGLSEARAGQPPVHKCPLLLRQKYQSNDSHFHLGSTRDPLRAGSGFWAMKEERLHRDTCCLWSPFSAGSTCTFSLH